MQKIIYKCGKCGLEHTVSLTDKDTLVSATLKICEDHRQHSPECKDWKEHIKIIGQKHEK